VELLFAAERMLEAVTDPGITDPNVRLVVTNTPDEGVGSVEAPWNINHRYRTDEKAS
jgi:F420-non-reducing hydrogenase large subunit